jgi:sugar phosphate isomerase/epimerase
MDRELPGRGIARIRELASVIRDAGYEGVWDIEVFSEEYWASDYAELLANAKVAFDALWD